MARRRVNSSISIQSKWSGNTDSFGAPSAEKSGIATLTNSSLCDDEVHDTSNLGSGGDVGGTFDVTSTKYTVQPASINVPKRGGGPWAVGSFWPASISTGNPLTAVSTSELALISMGTTAISRTLPTTPAFSLSNALGELRNDGLPKMVGSTLRLRDRSRDLRKSGGEYLNVEFGWRPLVSDLLGLARTVKTTNKVINQYRKSSDNRLRRRYSFPDRLTSQWYTATGSGSSQVYFTPGLDFLNTPGSGSLFTQAENKTWFSGAFKYHIPLGDSFPERMVRWESEANRLLGTRLTPEVVYNLEPWTWALDWFTNTGDVMKNISSLGHDGLVLEWGYIMDQAKATYTITGKTANLGTRWPASARGPYTCSVTTESKRLKRRVSTPFGFGFNMSTLSVRQDAVLVALGLSKGLR